MSIDEQKIRHGTRQGPTRRKAATGTSVTLAPLQRRIISAVVRAGALTRGDIARELRLSRSNLSPVILGLVDERLLVSVGQDESRGGRRGDLLGVAGPESAVVAGLEIDVSRIRVLVATLGTSVVAARHEVFDTTGDPGRTLELAAAIVTDALDRSYGPLVSVGISLPAAIDVDRGVPAVAPALPQWVDFPVVDRLAEHLSTRVFMDSDLNALALAEMTVPHHPPLGPAFLVVKAHEGIGCGIVINNSVFRGSQGSAGEMGHICVDPKDSTICACGHRGCLEAVVSPANLAARARELARTDRSPALGPLLDEPGLTMDAIGRAVLEGDPVAASLMRELGMRIGFVLAGAISFFNPSSIVVSTARMLGSQVLMGAIRHGVYERAFAGATRRLQIVESGLGDDAVAVGAAALARDGFLGTAGRVAGSRGIALPSATP